MTLNQLLREVYALGFEENGELNESFLFSANRANRTINASLAPEKRDSFIALTPRVSYYMERYYHEKGAPVFTIKLKGASYCFKHTGIVSYKVTDSSGTRSFELNSSGGIARGFFDGECEISFHSEYLFVITDLVAYSDIISDKEEDIKIYSGTVEVNIPDYINDFGIATSVPTDKNGDYIAGSYINGNILSLPFEFSGEIFISYKPAVSEISINEPERKINIPSFAEHLLSLLTASYFWLDDDPEKADYYASVYRSELNRILATQPKGIGNDYKDVLGWA